jgi:hypothetical protein
VKPPAPRAGWLRRHGDVLLLGVTALVSVAPFAAVSLVPFTDLPEHLAVMATLRHWADPAWSRDYVFAIGQSQYVLYHAVGALLSFVTGDVDVANRWMMAAAGVALPFSLRSYLGALGRDRRLAIFACPLFWNRALTVGFLPYIASIPLLFFVLALATREATAPRRGRTAILALLALAVFYMHASAFTLLVVIAPVQTAVLWGPRLADWSRAAFRPLARRLSWLVPSVICAALWAVIGSVTVNAGSLADEGEIGRMNVLRSAHAFSLWAHDSWSSHVDEWCAFGYWAIFLTLLGGRAWSIRRQRLPVIDVAYVPFVLTAILYFVLPFRVGAGGMINVRLAPVLAAFAVLALPAITRRPAWESWLLRGVALVSMVLSVEAARQMRAIVREELAGVRELVETVPPGARLLQLSFRHDSPRSSFPVWIHLGAYHRAHAGGVAEFSFTQLHHWPLHYAPGAGPPSKPMFWDSAPCLYSNATDGAYYDYLLVYGPVNPFRDEPPGPAFHAVGEASDFVLYAKDPQTTWPAWSTPDHGPCGQRDPTDK